MRIYLSCLQSKYQYPIAAYKFWYPYFKNGIEEAGCEWLDTPEVDWAEGLIYTREEDIAGWKGRTWTKVLEDIKRKHERQPIDLFLGYLYPHQVEEQAIQQIQKLGIPCVNFFCDNVRLFRKVPAAYCCFDLHWVPEYKALRMYKSIDLPTIHLPMPVWIKPSQRDARYGDEFKPTFIGGKDIQRERLFYEVLSKYPEIELRGPGWLPLSSPNKAEGIKAKKGIATTLKNQADFIKANGLNALLNKYRSKFNKPIDQNFFTKFSKEPVFGEQYCTVTKNASITLGVNRYPSFHYPVSSPDTYSRLRDIEAPMMGACYLTEWTEGLEHLYELGNEIETYRTADEMVEKIKFLQANADIRKMLRQNGQQRALFSHSVSNSIHRIVGVLFGDKSTRPLQ